MSINDHSQIDDYLLGWINLEPEVNLSGMYWHGDDTMPWNDFIKKRLNQLDADHFPIQQEDDRYQTVRKIQLYLEKQMGKKVKKSTRKQLIQEPKGQKLLKLLLYLCIQSKHKNYFINQIMILPTDVQSLLMKDIQQISDEMQNLLEVSEILKQMETLEDENQLLKAQIKQLKEQELRTQLVMEEWEEENKKLSFELEKYKKQKDKVIESLNLVDIHDYIDLFRKVQHENIYLNQSITELQEKNYNLNDVCEEMKQQIKQNTTVIAELNDQITRMKQKYASLAFEKTCIESSLDGTRSFGKIIEANNYPEAKTQKRISRKWEEQDTQNLEEIIPISLKETSVQLQQLRKYNSQINQKLENCHRNINNMNEEGNYMRDKNTKLQKRIKFYKQQLFQLRELNKELQHRYQSGQI